MLTSTLDLHTVDSATEAVVLAAVLAVAYVVLSAAFGRLGAALIVALDLVSFAITGNIAIALATAIVGALALVWRPPHATGDDALPLARELTVLLSGLMAYTFGRTLVESDAGVARENTARIIDVERALGLFLEPDIQAWVLESEGITRAFNWMYSFGFLAAMAGALLWLWANDRASYRLLRNSLGVSAVLGIAIIALYPAAPPRLTESTGIIDSVVVFGREHTFVNEFAAMPSLHVGWLAATGYVLGRRLRPPAGPLLMIAPAAFMLITVIATGNHFWLDGLVGTIITVGPAIALSEGGALVRRSRRALQATGLAPQGALRVAFSTAGLGALLSYLLVAEWLTPGFTNFWGYLVFQVAVFMVLLIAGEIMFAADGGLSWTTHVLAVVCAYADVLGTDGNLYARIDEYDKLTHFLGIAAVTACFYDVLRALSKRGVLVWAPADRFGASVVAGVTIGIGWEVYEYLGDVVFHTTRVNSRLDTINDIVFDTLGALLVGLMLLRAEQRGRADEPMVAGTPIIEAGAEDESTLTRA